MPTELYFRVLCKLRQMNRRFCGLFELAITRMKFSVNRFEHGPGLRTNGIPWVRNNGGEVRIGRDFRLNNGFTSNVIGRTLPCAFTVARNARLTIGDGVGISHSAIFCAQRVTIGNRVLIGANCVIYDTDFHGLHPEQRSGPAATREVVIGDNAFIGAHSTILKGSRIGENSVVGACSLVVGEIPPNQIWAGNPARFIRQLDPVADPGISRA